tara:strand:+ start:3175 stop:4014 length:840 start_codon:yes stop_codon:yes gene_type:complete
MAILSIQSFVSKGYVGNRAAAFVLERLGIEVWSIPTVLFSNHSGYGKVSGNSVDSCDIQSLFEGIAAIAGLSEIEAVVTGYIYNQDQVKIISNIIKQINISNIKQLYLCDPVVANERGLFVDKNVAASVSEFLFPLANIITPNIYELEYFSGIKINSSQSLIEAAKFILKYGPQALLVKSVKLKSGYLSNFLLEEGNVWSIEVPRFDGVMNGAGDVYAAILIAEIVKGKTLLDAFKKAVQASWEIIKNSKSNLEINLISSQNTLESSKVNFSIRKISTY